jgi:predicted nucleic acid-binding Zn ribbon protein
MLVTFKCENPECGCARDELLTLAEYEEKKDSFVCSECGASMKRDWSQNGNTKFNFKGSGFYTTDYKGKR